MLCFSNLFLQRNYLSKKCCPLPLVFAFDSSETGLPVHTTFPQCGFRSWMDAWITSISGCYFVFPFFITFSESKVDKLLHQPPLSISRRRTPKICEQNEIWHVNRRQNVVGNDQIIKFKKEPEFWTSHNTVWCGRHR